MECFVGMVIMILVIAVILGIIRLSENSNTNTIKNKHGLRIGDIICEKDTSKPFNPFIENDWSDPRIILDIKTNLNNEVYIKYSIFYTQLNCWSDWLSCSLSIYNNYNIKFISRDNDVMDWKNIKL